MMFLFCERQKRALVWWTPVKCILWQASSNVDTWDVGNDVMTPITVISPITACYNEREATDASYTTAKKPNSVLVQKLWNTFAVICNWCQPQWTKFSGNKKRLSWLSKPFQRDIQRIKTYRKLSRWWTIACCELMFIFRCAHLKWPHFSSCLKPVWSKTRPQHDAVSISSKLNSIWYCIGISSYRMFKSNQISLHWQWAEIDHGKMSISHHSIIVILFHKFSYHQTLIMMDCHTIISLW